MDFSRYENLRTLVRANFSEQTRALVDEALVYADGKLTGLCRYDGTPLLDHGVAVELFGGIRQRLVDELLGMFREVLAHRRAEFFIP